MKRKTKRNINMCFNVINTINEVIYCVIKTILFIITTAIKGFKNNKFIRHTGYSYFDLMNKIDRLDPRQFEIFCCEMYKALGYKATLTQESRDMGRDIILKKDGKTYFVECKHYGKNNSVGSEIIMKAYGSACLFGVDGCFVVTTSYFTKSAYESARMVDNIKLISYTNLIDILLSMNPISVSRIINKLEIA